VLIILAEEMVLVLVVGERTREENRKKKIFCFLRSKQRNSKEIISDLVLAFNMPSLVNNTK